MIRTDALDSLAVKRYYADGAALFWILPTLRNPRLLKLLVDFQVAANFLDHASERAAADRGASGGNLMLAFTDAVDLATVPDQDYYADNRRSDDGGYLGALVLECRAGCATLARYGKARDLLVREAGLTGALELGHDPDARRRDATLERFILREHGSETEATWFELAAGGASAVTVLVLLALAADERTTDEDLRAAIRAYTWVGALSTLLDSYVDRAADEESGDWSVVSYYGDEVVATERIAYVIDRSLREVAMLRDGERHTVIVSSMIALFLSRDNVRSEEMAGSSRTLSVAGGSLTRLLTPVLRLWRTVYGLRAV